MDQPHNRTDRPSPSSGGADHYAAVARLLTDLTDHPDDDPHAPIAIPGFRIDRTLGSGGGGHVFRAFRDGSDQAIALKLLTMPLGHGRASARVFREIDIVQSLHLPAVARLLDHGTHQGRVWLATEFIDGPTLAEFGPSLRADTRRAAELLVRIADAVQSIHEHGVIHRDLKPGNVIITARDQPVLVDFGLAALIDDHAQTLTADGAPLGTPAFMAPEQARGERAAISTRTDVFGLGATACWLLTGEHPFNTECSLHEAVRRVGHDAPRDPRELRRDLPKPLAAVIAKAAAADPARRYPSAAEFAADLRRWLKGEPVTAVRPGAWQKAVRWVGRHPVAATAGACVGVGIAILGSSALVTALAIHHLRTRPADFLMIGEEDQCRKAQLISMGGNVLGSIGDPAKGDIVRLATLEDWPTEYSPLAHGSQVAVIAVESSDPTDGTHGQVWVCDPMDLTRPLIAPADVPVPPPSPDGYRNFPQGALAPHRVIKADIYPDVPGPEFIIVGEPIPQDTPNVIFVQDLRGTVHFRAWHFGKISDAAWWPDARLLVLTGDRHGHQTHQWHQFDNEEAHVVANGATIWPYPRIAFAVRPDVRGDHGWLRDSRDAAPDDATRPLAWYKALWPPRGSIMFTGLFGPTREQRMHGRTIELMWKCNQDEFEGLVQSRPALRDAWMPGVVRWQGGWSMYIDDLGHVIGPRPDRADEWKRNFTDGEEGARRVEEMFTLVDFPTGVEGWRGEDRNRHP